MSTEQSLLYALRDLRSSLEAAQTHAERVRGLFNEQARAERRDQP